MIEQSEETETSRVPSGLKPRAVTVAACGVKVIIAVWVLSL
jgi:hypothetical protein